MTASSGLGLGKLELRGGGLTDLAVGFFFLRAAGELSERARVVATLYSE
jgi:hypothetical protein